MPDSTPTVFSSNQSAEALQRQTSEDSADLEAPTIPGNVDVPMDFMELLDTFENQGNQNCEVTTRPHH